MASTLAPLQPGFMLLQGNRLEDLRDLLSHWIVSHPLRPLEHECILVQSNGIAQWLKMALARDKGGCGIAAAMNVDLPGRFLWQVYRSVFDELPTISPYDKGPLTWRIYQLLQNWEGLEARLQVSGESIEALEPLQSFLAQDDDPRRLHQLAANLADLYDQYQVYRADWLAAWEQHEDVIITAQMQQLPLEQADRWQAIVWRLLVTDVQNDPHLAESESPWARASRASIHQAVLEACTNFSPEHRPSGLPRRVLVFGISSLPRQTLDLLHAIAPFTQVLVFASNPCQHYWGDIVEGKELLRQEYKRIRARKVPADLNPEDLHLAGHPLLASWGKQGRDYLHLLDEQDTPEEYREHLAALQKSIDIYRDPLEDNTSLLAQLQSDIFDLRPLQERKDMGCTIDPEQDQSLQFIVAHSAQREVEILHDQLLKEFEQAHAQGESLPPRDVLVMVPDINDYAPHIQAVFGRYAGSGDQRDSRFLPFHIADQGQRGQNTLLIAFESILGLPHSRFMVSELLDLLDTPALRERYQLAEADLPRLTEWIRGANIRWGLDAKQRAELGLPEEEQNTWLFGMRRLLLGFASGASGPWLGIEPHDEVAGLEAALLGPLTQLLNDLAHTREQLQALHTPKVWLDIMQEITQRFFSEVSQADSWALSTIETQFEQLETTWQHGGLAEQALPLQVVSEELLSALDQPTLTQKFLGGAINFATLMPMRAIPFQQVWLLGMNDGDYPRSVRPADFDLMSKHYRPGDRGRREDDRYLFLEALLSARKKLVISWVGRSIRDNTERPPSVLVGQLRDHIQAGWTLTNSDESILAALTTEHPLQAFSPRYFVEPNPESKEYANDKRLHTFVHEWQSILQQPPTEQLPVAEWPQLPPWYPESTLSLRQLNDFLRCPTEALYKERFHVHAPHEADIPLDVESFEFNGLEAWSLKDTLILDTFQLGLSSQDYAAKLEQAIATLVRQGTLIEGALGALQADDMSQLLPDLFRAWQGICEDFTPLSMPESRTHTVKVQGHALAIELNSPYLMRHNESHQYQQVIVQTSDIVKGKKYTWRNLTRPWLQHLLTQVLKEQPVPTHVLSPKGTICMPGLTLATAQELLAQLVTWWWQGMQAPLPTALNLGIQWVEAKAEGKPDNVALDKAQKDYSRDAQYAEHFAAIYSDFDALEAHPDFIAVTEALYTPLYHAIKVEASE
ncbi:exodeoxyribonuclease V subunit gamma [Aliidiomarina taiwanensis]|uniref:RecBCD enzyme subunit RecC n=1 Tax=Aliidiomarina taiwanensis TaxID=946228 RepID=A0A432X9H2_9GAMM|nr:exodeoxyribonuclease V subunit gamma [Aliidiomarina taiwanensis]RUO43960.1 exodeoxyribonuclease V subunit gamma [Aliidiomarina taiwanensis]